MPQEIMRPDVKSAQGKRIPRAVALRKTCSRENSLEQVLLQSGTFRAWGDDRMIALLKVRQLPSSLLTDHKPAKRQ
ncbi:MAG: hypothetical protein PUP91_19075 [Rhizonema sp. PD37]|nr:hypothetical protein [Rhizonema sp. PD37]